MGGVVAAASIAAMWSDVSFSGGRVLLVLEVGGHRLMDHEHRVEVADGGCVAGRARQREVAVGVLAAVGDVE